MFVKFNRTFIPTLPSLLVQPDRPFIHRDLSWLQFNERVLSEARSSKNPLLERLKFLSISASNLDEFFMIRFATLGKNLSKAKKVSNAETRRLIKFRANILEKAAQLNAKQDETLDILSSDLSAHGLYISKNMGEGNRDYELSKKTFEKDILPYLGKPEPFQVSQLNNLENLQMAMILRKDLWLKIPRTLPSVFVAPDPKSTSDVYLFFLDDLILTHLAAVLKTQSIPSIVRVTRDSDVSMDLTDEDPAVVPDLLRTKVGSRNRGRPVRIQYLGGIDDSILSSWISTYRLSPFQIFSAPSSLGLQGVWSAVDQLSHMKKIADELNYPSMKPVIPTAFKTPAKIFDRLKQEDLLLHHPYDSFDAYVNFISAGVADPDVEMIQQTVYRMDAVSPVLDLLKTAAKTKTVRVVVELRARFDELNNLALAEDLRKAGVEVAFGFEDLKIHAKIACISRRENTVLKHYIHLSTGNYNAKTARLYEDIAVMSTREDLGEDTSYFFDQVFKGELPTKFKTLIPAPQQLHRKLIGLIHHEIAAAKAGKPARIIAKVNALVEEDMCAELYKASQAGVKVDLIVRGACSLIPGVPELSKNITVVSIVDRFLEHSRIYYFENADQMYLSSADWMPRNFFSRLELAFPVLEPKIKQFILKVILPAYMGDTVRARELTQQGTWKRRTSLRAQIRSQLTALGTPLPLRAQFFFSDLAVRQYEGLDSLLTERQELPPLKPAEISPSPAPQ